MGKLSREAEEAIADAAECAAKTKAARAVFDEAVSCRNAKITYALLLPDVTASLLSRAIGLSRPMLIKIRDGRRTTVH